VQKVPIDIMFAWKVIQDQRSQKSVFREYLASYWSNVNYDYYDNYRL